MSNISKRQIPVVRSNLKRMLNERNISIREIATIIDYDREAVRKLANNELTRIPTQLIALTCKYLLCDVKDLLVLEYDQGEKRCQVHKKF